MKINHHNVFESWPLKDKSVQAIITSPPYWSLRKYDIPDVVIGGESSCTHEFKEHYESPKDGKNHPDRPANVGANRTMSDMDIKGIDVKSGFCQCGSWKGQYGLEPSFKDYIEHTKLWAKEAHRVLRDDGVMFLNLGDSYNTISGNAKMSNPDKNNRTSMSINGLKDKQKQKVPSKCKLLIPHRIAITLIDDGWILRNDICWIKRNPTPESVTDRFSKSFEFIFFFSKSQKYYFDLNSVKEQTTTKDNITRDRETTKLNNTPGRTKMGGLVHNNYDFKNPKDAWTFNTQPSPEKHYAMWPEKLVKRMVKCSTKARDTVLDPFAGSGTTLRVAEKWGRYGLGFDLGYKDIQKRRLKNIQKEMFV